MSKYYPCGHLYQSEANHTHAECGAIFFHGSEISSSTFQSKMATRGQAQVYALFKDFAFIFPGSEAVKSNTDQVLLDHNLEMIEVGKLKMQTHMVLNVIDLFGTSTILYIKVADANWKVKLSGT